MTLSRPLVGWLYISPLVLVLIPFFVLPILVVLVASVFETDGFGGLIPSFTLANYATVLTSELTFNLYFETVKFTILTWFFTLILGFFVAYFLVFHVRNPLLAIGLFLLCTVPFWTSNIIRMISWIPLLGKEGLINSALLHLGLIHERLGFLLYSSFAVVVAYGISSRSSWSSQSSIPWRVSTNGSLRPRSMSARAASTLCGSSSCRCPRAALLWAQSSWCRSSWVISLSPK